ncbi:uncharacterized protein PgNI_01265 [Pyricularia grisea]|uniref:Uncharacterized protein n=1 Tax=Pyricularia grisea TaxID=148305 RepID=A0A6P8BMW7_PYRGI|nr:uncharacterized protein PgNI_01265 [Pyricularia grisea]TLD17802.1 hypothetical protein PgNI_01265 [Pyricularia grisea]
MSVDTYSKKAHYGTERLLTLGAIATFIETDRPYPVSTAHVRCEDATRTDYQPFAKATFERSQVYTSQITHTRPAQGYEFIPHCCSEKTIRQDRSTNHGYSVSAVIKLDNIKLGPPIYQSRRKDVKIVVADRRRYLGANRDSRIGGENRAMIKP